MLGKNGPRDFAPLMLTHVHRIVTLHATYGIPSTEGPRSEIEYAHVLGYETMRDGTRWERDGTIYSIQDMVDRNLAVHLRVFSLGR